MTTRKYTGECPNLVLHSGQKLAYTADYLAWPKGTPPRKYTNGKATPRYRKALHESYPKSWFKWSSHPRSGGSCDVGVGTICRYSGYDRRFQRGLSEQIPDLKRGYSRKLKSQKTFDKTKKWVNTGLKSTKKAAPGDVGFYDKPGKGNSHIWMCMGGNWVIESNFHGACTLHWTERKYTKGRGEWGIYRACHPMPIVKGDKGTEVTKLQKFLNWYGNYRLTVNGECDSKTVAAIKDFQKKEKLTADGTFGNSELSKVGKYGKVSVTGSTAAYTGSGLSSGGTGTTIDPETGEVVDNGSSMLTTIETLFSSEGYDWITSKEEEETESQKRLKAQQKAIKDFLTNIKIDFPTETSVPDTILENIAPTSNFIYKPDIFSKSGKTTSLLSYPNLVEAPYIELDFNGVVIGEYGNKGDKYPNYISSMEVNKVNGRINTYTINLVYQIRSREDPNFIDSLLSRTGYTNPLKIRYGDSSSPGMMFKEENAIILDVKSKDNVASSSITYTITAISSIISANQSHYTFKETVGKPSSVINGLLSSSGQVSSQLLSAFPGMANSTFVNSKNLIPTNDDEVVIGGMKDVSPLTYLEHVVGCMTNSNNSSYFLTYNDDANGAYFKISEVSLSSSQEALYEIDVGYPGNNFVTNFQLCDNIYWPLVYEYNGNIKKYNYSIDNKGNINSYRTNSLFSDNKYLEDSIINSNWWKFISEFPISAQVTLKGLTIPVMLMTYIRVNTLFYGQSDIASGLYVVTDQQDSISSNGYTTTLTLLRVGK